MTPGWLTAEGERYYPVRLLGKFPLGYLAMVEFHGPAGPFGSLRLLDAEGAGLGVSVDAFIEEIPAGETFAFSFFVSDEYTQSLVTSSMKELLLLKKPPLLSRGV